MKKAAIAVGILALLIGAAWLVRELLFEKTTRQVEKGYTGEAAYNPYFALRELYRGLGAQSLTVSGVQRLPPNDHVLILAQNERALVRGEVQRLLRWVENGGHLLVPANHRKVAKPFLEAAGVQRFKEDEADDDDHLSQSQFKSERLTWPKLYTEEERPLVRSDGEEDAAWVIAVEYGAGILTIPVSLRELNNQHLAAQEHADLAWWLVSRRDGSAPAGVWITFRQAPTSVWTLLANRARPVVLALALLSVVGLALFARPFGPKLEAPPRDRRHLAEHLRATGRYLWDREVEHTLLQAVQAGLKERLARGGQPEPRQIVEWAKEIAASSGLDAKDIHEAITLPSTRDPQQFTDAIHKLEQIRRKA